jgi:membrane protein implicated in regulation of membrane protease activity
MNIKNYLVKIIHLIITIFKCAIRLIAYTILLLVALYFIGYSADIMDKKPQESLGLFMLSCSIFVFLLYRFLTRENKADLTSAK